MDESVSIIILCYKHFDYIYNTIDSVIIQNYENIELLISDDGSENFPQQEIENYINQHKKSNIKNVIFNINQINLGTVRHINKAIKLTNGNIISLLAADDEYSSCNVIQTYVNGCQEADSKTHVIMAQTAMFDEEMKNLGSYYMQPHIENLLKNEDYAGLFNQLACYAYLPTVSTVFKKSFFEQYGYFDEAYDLVEDWGQHLFIARNHIKIHYLNVVTVNHRSGGISHGNSMGTKSTQIRYAGDLLKIVETEILPYGDQLKPEVLAFVKHRYRKDKARYDLQKYKSKGILGRMQYNICYFDLSIQNFLRNCYNKIRGRQYHVLIVSILLMVLNPWISIAFSKNVAVLLHLPQQIIETRFSLFLHNSSLLLFAVGIFIACLYLVSKAFDVVDRYPKIYP